ncbi:CWF complex protein sap62 [Friedmanniomyces endolithicus]|uniref:CWF complex protein sap62 n=1 Tax=Friedmanniomyces endolithicus TaxID=329885 RepID=A0AAN6QUS0_9PEZI|nr:CWF complex protein sap62 [Friedmanniomyces endolithicus]KAK0303654.1 CWF complex protein sap62 [Friedmanniomyces endolithicus]KAK0313229.1 CWF complex protein sap62 [Friedmanniomyces endolithicus]KAK0823474.1 CWF complex protein sap62 [Friedmanniomyces endolithicus]KAK0913659.1 CWF complex protein sap62 [Friedmanniomyces endolithicus]
MDYQNRAGSKFGGGGVASQSATNADRRERLRKLALETIDLDKDPYFFKNHVGSFECRLCLTVHQNDGSYLAHTQGRKHQTNLARRAAKDAQLGRRNQEEGYTGANAIQIRKNVVKIGRPGYKITKTRDPITRHQGLLFQLQYPEIAVNVVPRVRFMSAYEQKVEDPPDKAYQYLLIAAEPYETCAFKLQAREVDRREERYWTWFDGDSKEFWVQITFKTEREERYSGVPGLGGSGGEDAMEPRGRRPEPESRIKKHAQLAGISTPCTESSTYVLLPWVGTHTDMESLLVV